MIDVIVGVEDPVAWHAANMERNPSHYSSILKFLGPKGVAFVQVLLAGPSCDALL